MFEYLVPVKLHPAEDHGHENLSHVRHVKWLSEVVSQWDGKAVDIGIVGIPYDGHSVAPLHGGARGPEAVREFLYKHYSSYNDDYDADLSGLAIADCGNVAIADSADHHGSYLNIEKAIAPLFDATEALIMIGGDSSATLGVARALIRPESAKRRIGLVDFEAHYDNREMDGEAYERGGSDWVRWLMEREPVPIRGSNIVMIGIHGFLYSPFDAKYAKEMGNTVFKPRDVRRLGIDEVANRTLERVTDGTDAFYVHLSVACTIDQTFIAWPSGFGSFVGGLMPWDVMDALVEFGKHPSCRGLLLGSFNPLNDVNEMLVKVVCEAVMQFASGVALRTTHPGPIRHSARPRG
jgi:formiminoglutamase